MDGTIIEFASFAAMATLRSLAALLTIIFDTIMFI
jgi:hypothetical protein